MHPLSSFLGGLVAGILVAAAGAHFYRLSTKRKKRGRIRVSGLTFGLASVRDLFAKLQRDAVKLDEEVTSDRLFNFVVTGHSMIDWIDNDSSVPPSARATYKTLYSDRWIKICRDLANGCKHFTLTRGKPVTSSTQSISGYGVGRYGKGAYGVGEESIKIHLNDGTKLSCLDLVQGVLSTWKNFFSTHGI